MTQASSATANNTTKSTATTATDNGNGANKSSTNTTFDLDQAIPIDNIPTYEMRLRELPENEVLPLIYGIFIEKDGKLERLTTYTFKSEIIDKTNLETTAVWENEVMRRADRQAGQNMSSHINKIAKMLASCIDTIGGYPLREVVQMAIGLNRKDAKTLFESMYQDDVLAMLLSFRTLYNNTFAYSVNEQECNCRKKTITDDSPESLHSIQDLTIRYLNISLQQPPIFKVIVTPFTDSRGKSKIDTVYLSPLKLYHYGLIESQNQRDDSIVIRQLQLCVVGMPQSEMNGDNLPGRIFDASLWEKCMTSDTRTDLEYGIRAISDGQKIGIMPMLEIDCPYCFEPKPITVFINWILLADLILSSHRPRSVKKVGR